MSSVLCWTVSLARCAWTRPCPRCDRTTVHGFAHRARLNANGKRLDAWLLFTCDACERTARLPVLERVLVARVDPALLVALERNEPAVLLPLAAERVGGEGFTVEGPRPAGAARVRLRVDPGVRVRLDRVLACGLGCSREAVRAQVCDGRALRRPVRDGQVVAVSSGE